MIIYLVKSLPKNTQGFYNDYSYVEKNSSDYWQHLDVKKHVHNQQKQILNQYESWHRSITRIAISLFGEKWWLSQKSRLIAWYPPVIEPLVYSVALIESCSQNKIDEIFIINISPEAVIYLHEFGIEVVDLDGIINKGNYRSRSLELLQGFKKIYLDTVYAIIRHVGSIIKIKVRCFGLKKIKRCFTKNVKDLDIIVSQVSFNTQSGGLQDHFFGEISEDFILANNNPILWVLRSLGSKRKAILNHLRQLEKNGYQGIILENEISLIDLFVSTVRAIMLEIRIKQQIQSLPPINILGFKSTRFLEFFFSLEFSFDGFLVASFSKKLFSFKKTARIIYPYEEKISERAILTNVKKHAPIVETIGYQHASTNSGHLYLSYRPSDVQPPKPDRLLTTGPAQKKCLCELWKWPEDKVEVLGSFRFHNMKNYLRNRDAREKNLRLFLIIASGYELTNFEQLIRNNYHIFDKTELLIRPTPFSHFQEQNNAIQRITNNMHNLKISKNTLIEEVAWSDCTLSCSTSAGIESILMGRINAYIDLNNYIIQDPYKGKFDEDKIFRLNRIDDITTFLTRIKRLSLDDYNVILDGQMRAAREIYSQPIKLIDNKH